ncbi:MAG: 3-oxoadipate enol-lactonase [Alphaproteobacteria bacterium]
MPVADVNGVSINYVLDGPEDAPVLMFSNSLGTDHMMWDAEAAHFAGDFRVLRYDTRGHGSSSVTEPPYTVEMLAGDALGLLDELGIGKVHFCGLSLGGLTGQAIALARPSVLSSLTLANTAANIGPLSVWDARLKALDDGGIEGIADAVMDRWLTPDCRKNAPAVFDRLHAMMLRNDKTGYYGCCCAVRDADFRQRLSQIQAPTLVIGGTKDLATAPELSEELAAGIPGAELKLIDGAPHISNAEFGDIFRSYLGDFLNRHR